MLGELARRGYEIVAGPGQRRDRGGQHLRLHRGGPAGVDRHHPRGRRPQGARASRRCWWPAAWSTASATSSPARSPRSTASWGSTSSATSATWCSSAADRPCRPPRTWCSTTRRRALLTTRGFAYLKVAEGCNNPCTFCAIPIWRGRFRSRTIESLVEEARQLEAAGITELNLIAQDTTRYGEDLGMRPPRPGPARRGAARRRPSIPWIRFLYAYPTTLDEDLLRLMGTEERFCSYLDMPLQHSHGDILAAMRRGGDAKRYLRLLERARELAPDVFLRSTFIVGFPGETEEHFQDLLAFVERGPLRPSRRLRLQPRGGHAGGGAAGPGAEEHPARRRLRQLLEAQRPIALERRRRLLGGGCRCSSKAPARSPSTCSRAATTAWPPSIDGRVLINDGSAPAGTLAEVEITEAYADDLVGHIVGAVRPGVPGVEIADASWPDAETADLAASDPDLPCTSSRTRTNSSDLPHGGVGTIGNFDGVHRGQRAILDRVVARAARAGRARRWSSPSIPIPWPCCAPSGRRCPSPRRAEGEAAGGGRRRRDAGRPLHRRVRAGRRPARSSATSCTAGWASRRSTSARASSSATGGRGIWPCCRRWAASWASTPCGVDEVMHARRAHLQHPHPPRRRRGQGGGGGGHAGPPLRDRRARSPAATAWGSGWAGRRSTSWPRHKLLPADGVYAGRVFFPSYPATFDCVTNIGTRPTVYENYQRVVESHILDFKAERLRRAGGGVVLQAPAGGADLPHGDGPLGADRPRRRGDARVLRAAAAGTRSGLRRVGRGVSPCVNEYRRAAVRRLCQKRGDWTWPVKRS